MHQLKNQASEELKPEANWDLIQEVVDFMEGRKRADIIQLMSQLTEVDLNTCSPKFQREFWEEMTSINEEEALNYRGKYMNKGFGPTILKKIALKNPKLLIERNLDQPEEPTYQDLCRLLSKKIGKKQVDDIRKAILTAKHNVWYRRLYRKIFGVKEKQEIGTEIDSQPSSN